MQLPAPTASGSFVKTPFPHLLVYALERRLTGTFELLLGAGSVATILVIGGCPAKVRTSEPVHFLGNVMMELGMISQDHLQTSLAQMQGGRLQGQIFLEIGAADPARLDAGLRSQVDRKIEHLFGLSGDTSFAYYDGIDLLQQYGGPPTPIDPFPVLWRGVRERPAREHVDATLRRIGNALLKAGPAAQFERFAFTAHEHHAVEMLRQRPCRAVDLTNIVGPGPGHVLVYFLMIMKQVELIDAAQAQAGHAMARPPTSQPIVPNAPPASGQAFARVQLQRQQAAARALVVEEHVAPSGANDERASSPGMQVAGAFGMQPPTSQSAFAVQQPPASAFGMQQPPASAFGPPVPAASAMDPVITSPAPAGGLMDIGSMISQTIQQSSMPPAMPAMSAPDVPGPPSAPPFAIGDQAPSSGSIPVPPSSRRGLTAEQNALKMKIVERAEQITGQDYFQMLALDRDAQPEEIQKAFFGLAKVWHPDRLPPALIDVKDACSKVFTHITEAHATLMDPVRRQEYMTLLKDGGATPEDQAKIQAIIEAATEFQKAEILLKRNPTDMQAYDIIKRCVMLDDEQADYLATLAWLDAQKPEWLGREKTLEKTYILDRCIVKNPNCERAFFYRGMLYKRAEELTKAVKDFKRAAELNPRNLDAMREVRLHNMRGGVSKPPPGMGGGGGSSRNSKQPPPETLGGIFGKLFKK